jgi:hypothetical protein
MNKTCNYDLKKIASAFRIYGNFISAEPYGTGHINDTFAVRFNQGGIVERYIFQRINTKIFKEPEKLMENIRRVLVHMDGSSNGNGDGSRKKLTLIETRDSNFFHVDSDKNYWRSYIFIEKAKTYDVLQNSRQAYEGAKAFGKFQSKLANLPPPRLHETIPNFHNTPKRFEAFITALEKDSFNRAKFAKKEIDFVLSKKDLTGSLISLLEKGKIPERITHNDTKINNVMMDDDNGEGICVIDLDTVMPGISLYDFGDLVRTSTSPAAEDEKDLSKVKMRLDMFESLVHGYLEGAGGFLNKEEINNLPLSGMLITLEIGIRFLTDYLSGDVYFKIKREEHNLDRSRTQFKLVESIGNHEKEMNKIVNKYSNTPA